jgi:hypothetical protein
MIKYYIKDIPIFSLLLYPGLGPAMQKFAMAELKRG